jgi:hypothetical protein
MTRWLGDKEVEHGRGRKWGTSVAFLQGRQLDSSRLLLLLLYFFGTRKVRLKMNQGDWSSVGEGIGPLRCQF